MEAKEANLLNFLKECPQFSIPIYQRTYSWTERECRQLWDDILNCGTNEQKKIHFIGSIVYISEGKSLISTKSTHQVIDGQQRLTTITLLLAALAQIIAGEEPHDGFTQERIKQYYLVNPLEKEDLFYKLLLTQTDRETLKAIVRDYPLPKDVSIRVEQNFETFKQWLLADKNLLPIVCKGLEKLVIVDVGLDRDHDNPQLIFESMNSTGKELSQADLIRNYVLMGLEEDLQKRLYEQYWRPMELGFGQEAYSTHFDRFMRHYLTVKTGEIPNQNAVYDAFKIHAATYIPLESTTAESIELLVKEIHEYSQYYCAMALVAEKDKKLNRVFHDLRELKVEVAYPMLLELYSDYVNGILSKDDIHTIARWIEAYVFRRAVCSIPTNSLNKTFATFTRGIDKNNYLQSIAAIFLTLPSYRRFPKDEEFARDLKVRDLYNFRIRMYWLRRLENNGRKEPVPVNEYSIEHIMPQNENLSSEWQNELGPDWQQVHETWLHTLGNLTLTGYNSEYGDKPFRVKRDMPGGFKESPLHLNKDVARCEHWNEHTIKDRAANMAKAAQNVWKAPQLSAEELAVFQHIDGGKAVSALELHPHLQNPTINELFQEFRKEVMALDPCVREGVFKSYIAFKAETNFVDVIPMASKVHISLNMRFPDLNDPKGIGRDVTNMTRGSNGDVEIQFTSLDELPYIIGLVRQSLDIQLGNGDDT